VANAFKRYFPLLAVTLICSVLALGDGALAILVIVAGIIVLPLIYGPDVEDIARATREGELDH
jgi:hypothetical protein